MKFTKFDPQQHGYAQQHIYGHEQNDEDIQRIQKEHLKKVKNIIQSQPCLHNGCPECHGTGIKLNGYKCHIK